MDLQVFELNPPTGGGAYFTLVRITDRESRLLPLVVRSPEQPGPPERNCTRSTFEGSPKTREVAVSMRVSNGFKRGKSCLLEAALIPQYYLTLSFTMLILS